MKYLYLDFEFNNTAQPKLNLVCCAFQDSEGKKGRIWLYHNEAKHQTLKDILMGYRDRGFIFVAYAVTAEARSLISLKMHPVKVKWIDLHLEHRLLANESDEIKYGKQYKDGAVVMTRRPKSKWLRTSDEDMEASGQEVRPSLASACFKFLGKEINSERKDRVRDLIIADMDLEDHKQEILEYCESDVVYLPDLHKEMESLLRKRETDLNMRKKLFDEMLFRGEYAARTAMMEYKGYPVKREWITNFMLKVPDIIKDMQDDIVSQNLPVIPFRWDKRQNKYIENQKLIKEYFSEYVFKNGIKDWKLTDKGAISLGREELARFFTPAQKYSYPRDCLGSQLLRFKALNQALNGFKPAKGKETILDKMGDDDRVRPWFGVFGSKTGRNQPPSTYFIPLKAAWMRAMIYPKPGKMIASIDYASQEYLISALESGDKNMWQAYDSGDPYLAFGKLAGAIPEDGTKKSHPKERDIYKTITLGISYGMGPKSMARDLTIKLGEEFTEDQAADLIQDFHKAFPTWSQWTKDYVYTHSVYRRMRTPDGWYIWGDETNKRSIGNFPSQSGGAAIMRRGVQLIQDAGLQIIYTLHDAFYIELDHGDWESVDLLKDKMLEAFIYYYEGEKKEWAKSIRMDGDAWGPGFNETNHIETPGKLKVKCQNIYVDERAQDEYKRFSKYLTNND